MAKFSTESIFEIKAEDLQGAINEILRDYGDVVYEATEKGLTAAEKVLIKNLKASSPKLSGEYGKGWKSKGKRYKLRRYVGNTKMVKGKKGEIPLSNIMEYSTKSPHQNLIKHTYYSSIEEMAKAVVDEIKEGIK